MDRSKVVAVATGIVSVVLAIAYLLLVQLLDYRGEMLPAPMGLLLRYTVF
ncbi:MAG: hypothetical protein ACFB0C_07445 [Leptolyngbyaceae cyanobacterium]